MTAHKVMNGTHLHHVAHTRAHSCHGRIAVCFFGKTGVTRSNDKTLGIIFLYPSVCNILVANIIREIIAHRCAGYLKHIRLVHKFESVDLAAYRICKSKELFDLCKIDSAAILMVALTVTCGNKKLCADVTAKVNNAYPLISCKNALIALGSLAACGAIKIIVCLGCPSTGNSYPNGAKLLCKSANLCVIEVDWGIILHKTCKSGVV